MLDAPVTATMGWKLAGAMVSNEGAATMANLKGTYPSSECYFFGGDADLHVPMAIAANSRALGPTYFGLFAACGMRHAGV